MRAKDVPRDISSRKQDVPAPGDGAASEWLRSYLQESIRPPFGHMASIPGILCQPTFQSLPGRINPGARPPGPYHLGRWPRRGGIQFHRTLSFFGTGHTKILSFSLQENASIPLSNFMAILLAQPTIHTFRPYLIRLIYMGETQLSIFCMRQG